MAKKGLGATEEERLRAVQLMEEGASPELVAEFLGVSRSSVFEWPGNRGRARRSSPTGTRPVRGT
jgi:transposase-like protein